MGSEKNCQIVVEEELRGGCWYLHVQFVQQRAGHGAHSGQYKGIEATQRDTPTLK